MNLSGKKFNSILVFDRGGNHFDLIESALVELQCYLAYASSLAEVWQQLESASIDVIILDLIAPNENGVDYCHQIKAHPQLQKIPLLILTHFTEKTDLSPFLIAGAEDFLNQPLNSIELQKRVQNLAQIKHQQEQLEALQNTKEKAEADRLTTNQQLQAVIDAVPGFISWIGKDLSYRGVNQNLAQFFNKTPEEFIGKPIGFLQNNQEFENLVKKFIQESHQNHLQKIINVELDYNYQEYLVILKKYNQGIVTIGIDITASKKAEKELQVVTKQMQTLLDTLKSGVLLQDKNWNIVLLNEAFCEIFDPNYAQNKAHLDSATLFKECLLNNEEFCHLNQTILEEGKLRENETLKLNNGRIVQRDYAPIILDGVCQGHLWTYRDVTEQKSYEEKIKQSLEEKELLLKEIHHRVKNNLLVVSCLLEMEEDYTEDQQVLPLLSESRNRIFLMAMIHEKLYSSRDINQVNFADYLQELVVYLGKCYNQKSLGIEVIVNVEPILINIETANPCGLIVNELISNAFKHAFQEDHQEAKIWLSFYKNSEDDRIYLTVKDNGVGLPPEFNINQTQSLGMELVSTLTEQLQGELFYQTDAGATFTIIFREINYKQRY